MKAERLLALLTILLSGKRVSARWLAEELEVSERTVYRDVEALSEAGFPVYATTGREARGRIAEYFDRDAITEQEDGSLLVRGHFPTGEWVLSWIMGLPGTVSIISPHSLRERMRARAAEIVEKNQQFS